MSCAGELLYPGAQSRDLADLDPYFRKNLQRTIQRMENEGYPVWVGATWRSKERQQHYIDKGYSKKLNSHHRGGAETKGKRRATAADIYLLAPLIYLPLHAKFYHRLSAVASEESLMTGARFTKRGVWAVFGLGWDPGHVQRK